MERLLQYLDDLDDLYGMVGLFRERLRSFLFVTVYGTLCVVVAALAARLAYIHPPIALATLTLLFVTLLYRSVTVPSESWRPTA